MDEKKLLAVLIDTAEEQNAANATQLKALAGAVKTIAGVVPAIQQAAGEEIGKEARRAFAETNSEAVKVASAFEEMHKKIQEVASAIQKKTLVQAAYPLALALLVAVLTVTGLNWYVGLKRAELIELKNQARQWEEKAGRAKLTSCGSTKRLCVKVDRRAGEFGDKGGVWMVIDGY